MTTYVEVPVPEERLTEVFALLAGQPSQSGPDPVDAAEPSQLPARLPRAGASGDDWSGSADPRFKDPDLVRAHLAPRSATVRGAALYLAERPGEWIGSEPIAEALGLEYGWNSLAGAFGAASRYFRNRGFDLPWHWTYDTPDGHVILMMDTETARVVREVLS